MLRPTCRSQLQADRSESRLTDDYQSKVRFLPAWQSLVRQVTIPTFDQLLLIMIRRRRNPLVQIILIGLVCLLGIGSRRYADLLPVFITAYAGDTLWALAAFLGIGLILPRASTRTIACLAMAFSVAVEISQLFHSTWIDSIRQTTLGGMILGFGFLWSDLACYAVGVGLGVMIDIGLSALKERHN
jgi:hypothetical protein